MARLRKDSARREDDSAFVFGGLPAPGQERAKRDALGPDTPAALYSEQRRQRYSIDPRARKTLILLIIAVALVPIAVVLPNQIIGFDGADAAVATMAHSVTGRLKGLGEIFSGTAAGMAMSMALCQFAAVAIAGAALSLNGAVFQGALKNALASPSTLGVMSGATLGNVVYTVFLVFPRQESSETSLVQVSEIADYFDSLDPLQFFLTTQTRTLFSLAGCAIVVVLVLLIAYVAGRGNVSKVGLLVSGQVFTAIIASIVEMIQYYIRDHGTEAQMTALRRIVGGDFADMITPYSVLLILVPVVVGIVIIMALRNRMNLLAFDEDDAKSMGITVNVTRNTVIIVCTVLTAVIVSFCGTVGFVGFIVPHLARRMVGPDFRYYIPASICLGAIYLTIAFYFMTSTGIFAGSVGTFTSLVGVVFFAVMAVRQRARGNVDWI